MPPTTDGTSDLRHVRHLTTEYGIWEHCLGPVPRVEHGFCTDDVSRLLVLAAREPEAASAADLARTALDYLESAYRGRGRFLDRRAADGAWNERRFVDDSCGRAIWGLGTAAALLDDADLRSRALRLFESAAAFRSSWLRSTAFSVLGAGAVLMRDPSNRKAKGIIQDASRRFGHLGTPRRSRPGRPMWPWPEGRLRYANATVCEMLLLIARVTGDGTCGTNGLDLLRWLVETETSEGGHLSVAPAGGWAPNEPRPAFDQQPIEVAALAEACATAWAIAGDREWVETIERCAGWFAGDNDVGTSMIDITTGGGFDGLTPTGPNINQGAESTIAAVTTLQLARRFAGPREVR
jgi:hypothetical protein